MGKLIENILQRISDEIDFRASLPLEVYLTALSIILIFLTTTILICINFDIVIFKWPAKKAQLKAKVEKKCTDQKTEPQKVHQLKHATTEELLEDIRMSRNKSKSKCKIALRSEIENLALKERVDYLLSVTPSQFVRDEDEKVLDSKFQKSVKKSVSWWTNSRISSDDSLNDDGTNRGTNLFFALEEPEEPELTEEEKRQIISSPSSIWSMGVKRRAEFRRAESLKKIKQLF